MVGNEKSLHTVCMKAFTVVVLPKGFEPLSSVPETEILSIELRKQAMSLFGSANIADYTTKTQALF